MQVFVVCVYVALSGSVIANEASVDSEGYVRDLTDPPTTDGNGNVVFKDLETIYIHDPEYPSQYVNVSKVDKCGNVNRPSSPEHNVAFYISADGGVSCLKDCDGSNTCIARCMRRTSTGIKFYTRAGTLTLTSSQGEVGLGKAIEEIPTVDVHDRKRRRRGVVSPTDGDHVIKILYALDKGCMDVFLTIAEDNSAQNAKMEAELFVMLQTCEVALHFASLEKHNAALTFDGAEYQLKLTTSLSGIVFPDETSGGTGFENFAWSEKNRDGDLLNSLRYEYYYSEQFIEQGGVTPKFAKYLDDKQPRPNNFDLAIALTGYDLTKCVHGDQHNNIWIHKSDDDSGLGASVYSSSACHIWNIRDYSSGVVEIYSLGLSRIISQGIAIMLGAQHDCLNEKNTSPYNFVHTSETTEFNTFSSCSAQQITSYMSSIPADERLPGCMSMLSSSEINFLTDFCQDTTSTAYTLDAQCAQMHPTSPQACVEDDYVKFDDCLNKVKRFIVQCSNTCNIEEESAGLRKVIDGTKCRDEDGTMGNKVCYVGCCVDPTTLCPV